MVPLLDLFDVLERALDLARTHSHKLVKLRVRLLEALLGGAQDVAKAVELSR